MRVSCVWAVCVHLGVHCVCGCVCVCVLASAYTIVSLWASVCVEREKELPQGGARARSWVTQSPCLPYPTHTQTCEKQWEPRTRAAKESCEWELWMRAVNEACMRNAWENYVCEHMLRPGIRSQPPLLWQQARPPSPCLNVCEPHLGYICMGKKERKTRESRQREIRESTERAHREHRERERERETKRGSQVFVFGHVLCACVYVHACPSMSA